MVSATEIGAALDLSAVRLDAAFSATAGEHVEPPLPGAIFQSSSNQGDCGQGRMSFVVQIPEGARDFVLPVVTGPAGTNQIVEITDVASARTIARLEDAPGLATWRFWRVDLPPDFHGGALRVELIDNGEEWGEWLAVSAPHLVRARQPTALARILAARLTGDAIASGWHPSVGAPPGGGSGYGTYGPKQDAAEGVIELDVATNGAGLLSVPVVTGPTADHADFEVADATTGAHLATLLHERGLSSWYDWQVALPAQTRAVRIRAIDDGAGWGEWIAIGQPRVTSGDAK